MADVNYAELVQNKRDQIVIVVIIILSIIISRSFYQQQMLKYNQLTGSIKTEKEKGDTLSRIVIVNEKVKKLKTKGWDTSDTNRIIEKVYNIGLESQVKLRDISPGEKRVEKNYILIPLTLSGEAIYSDFMKFAKIIETYQMLTRIRSVSLGPIGAGQEKKTDILLKVDMVVEAVYLK
ncbi:MAG: type 4a pilus biogenesis protein PilO [Candidatus Omnitrophota bacterium]